MRRLIETDWACGGVLALKVPLPTRNRHTFNVRRLAKPIGKSVPYDEGIALFHRFFVLVTHPQSDQLQKQRLLVGGSTGDGIK